jgi:hypothetical protein
LEKSRTSRACYAKVRKSSFLRLYLNSCEVLPVQPVDATPLWSVDLTTRFKGPILSGCGSLLPKQDGVFFALVLADDFSLWNSWT